MIFADEGYYKGRVSNITTMDGEELNFGSIIGLLQSRLYTEIAGSLKKVNISTINKDILDRFKIFMEEEYKDSEKDSVRLQDTGWIIEYSKSDREITGFYGIKGINHNKVLENILKSI